MYRQVSWLAALALPVRLPDPAGQQAQTVSVALWGKLAAYSCGGSLGIGPHRDPHRVPYSPDGDCSPAGTDTPSLSPVGVDLVKHRLQP
jgi:hypothetical protein